MNRVSLALTVCSLAAIVGLVAAAGLRIAGLESRELNLLGAPVALAAGTSQSLLEVDLQQGDEVTFEVCSADAMQPDRWGNAIALSIDAGADHENVVTVTLDPGVLEAARRSERGACITFAGGTFEISDHYAVSTRDVTPALEGVEVRAHVLARHSLTPLDRNFVFATLVLALLLVVGLALRAPGAEATAEARDLPVSLAIAVAGVLAFVCCHVALSMFAPSGPTSGLVAGLVFATFEIAIAVALVSRAGRVDALAMQRPTRAKVAVLAFAIAPVIGVALRFLAAIVLSFGLTTGEAPIEAFVSWPSGLLSFALLSVVAPIGEEVFFRGFVYGILFGKGGTARAITAFLGAWLLFVVAHLWQTWGNWGGLLSVALAGLGFTVLRATTRSTLVSTVAHLVYNGLLAATVLVGG